MLRKILLFTPLAMTLMCNTAKAGTENPRPNSVRIIPAAIYGVFNPSFGIAYERQIKVKKVMMGVYLPAYYGQLYIPYAGGGVHNPIEDGARSLFFNPGIKFYLFDHTRMTFAVGPSYFTTIGKGTRIEHGGGGLPYRKYEANFIQSGLMANVHLRVNASPKFFIGFDFGMGPCFGTQYKENDRLVYEEPESVYILCNFHLGFRF